MLTRMCQKNEGYQLKVHPQAAREIAALPPTLRQRLLDFCQREMVLRPTIYARPLRGTEKGYWKLKIGPYLVGFKILDGVLHLLGVIPALELYREFITPE